MPRLNMTTDEMLSRMHQSTPGTLPDVIDLTSRRERLGLEVDHLDPSNVHQRQFLDIIERDTGEFKKRRLIDYLPEYLKAINFNKTKHDPDVWKKASIEQQELSRDIFSGGLEIITTNSTAEYRAGKRIEALTRSRRMKARSEAIGELLGYPEHLELMAGGMGSGGLGKGGGGVGGSE